MSLCGTSIVKFGRTISLRSPRICKILYRRWLDGQHRNTFGKANKGRQGGRRRAQKHQGRLLWLISGNGLTQESSKLHDKEDNNLCWICQHVNLDFPLHMHYKFPLMWLGMLLHPTHFAQATLLSSSASLLCIMTNSTSIRVPILILVLLLMHMTSSEARTFQFRVRLRIKEWIAVLFYVIC